jgi:hypothetical protein
MEDSVEKILLVTLVAIVAVYLIRELLLWYWKVNELLNQMKTAVNLLATLAEKAGATEEEIENCIIK